MTLSTVNFCKYSLSIFSREKTKSIILTKRFRRQLIKIVELSSQMSEKTISNDEKQLTEIKLVNVIHGLAQRKKTMFVFLTLIFEFVEKKVGCRWPRKTNRFSKLWSFL